MMKKLNVVLLILVLAAAACKKDFAPGATATPKTSNGWWVTYYFQGAAYTNMVFFSTYNTSANKTDSMWIDNLQMASAYGLPDFKGTVALNYTAQTFNNALLINDPSYGGDSLKIINGKIISLGGHSTTGVPTDSLYFQFMWSDDSPAYGDTVTVAGTARTGFIADDY